jgi:hypothetical protein
MTFETLELVVAKRPVIPRLDRGIQKMELPIVPLDAGSVIPNLIRDRHDVQSGPAQTQLILINSLETPRLRYEGCSVVSSFSIADAPPA